MVKRQMECETFVTIALVGKYVELPDAYLSVVEALTHEANIPESDIRMFHYQNDPQCTDQLIRWQKEGVSGLFLFCDIEAWQLMGLMEAHGLCDHFSLVGFDNIQSVIGFPSPLCTIDSSIEAVSKAAFDILIRRIDGERSPAIQRVFPVQLVCRGSCKPPRSGQC